MFKSLSTSLIARGILAVIIGIIALAWPSVTVLALVILFAVYAFIAAGLQAARAFSSRKAGPVIGHLLLGLADLAAGVIALAWPSVTVLALVILFAVYAFISAGLQAARAFSSAKAGPVFGHLLLGLADLAAGVIALAWPGPTALVLVLIVGVWAITAGLIEIAAAFG
ncbi:MAG TPA: DUF308 domain-containing protein, partial [Streptosporangiaceae bacterium]|nr:DUF308 domain-containing protein [Streptosporangiaceae bacterium]